MDTGYLSRIHAVGNSAEGAAQRVGQASRLFPSSIPSLTKVVSYRLQSQDLEVLRVKHGMMNLPALFP